MSCSQPPFNHPSGSRRDSVAIQPNHAISCPTTTGGEKTSEITFAKGKIKNDHPSTLPSGKPPTTIEAWSDILNAEYGFFPNTPNKMPLLRLPSDITSTTETENPEGYYEPWEKIVDDMHGLILTGRIRQRVERLPLLDVEPLLSAARVADKSTIQTLPDSKHSISLVQSTSIIDPKASRHFLFVTLCLRRAHLVLSLIAHAYIVRFPGKNAPLDPADTCRYVLPQCLAVPWYHVSHLLGLKPVMGYAAIDLTNFKLLEEDEPPSLSNLSMLHTFTGGVDEAWFYLVPLAIEAIGGCCVGLLLDIQQAIWSVDMCDSERLHENAMGSIVFKISSRLETIKEKLLEMGKTLKAMYAKNDPHIFWHRTRPYSAGSKNNPTLPNGLYYEGVPFAKGDPYCLDVSLMELPELPTGTRTGSWRAYAGASAGQSPLIHALDVGLSIRHEPMKPRMGKTSSGPDSSSGHSTMPSNPMLEMREYLNARDRAFLSELESGPCIRTFCLHHPTLAFPYNACIDALKKFRDAHMQLVSVYIIAQSRASLGGANSEDDISSSSSSLASERGTGGTALIPFLKQVRQETVDAHIPVS